MSSSNRALTAGPQIPIEKSKRMKVTGQLKVALDAMVWQGLTRNEAADHAGLQRHSLYSAFRKPHVRQYYLAECEVLRTSGRARRLLRLEQLAEQNTNLNAAVNAIKAAEGMDQLTAASLADQQTPGLTIVIVNGASVQPKTIDASPSDVRTEDRRSTIDYIPTT